MGREFVCKRRRYYSWFVFCAVCYLVLGSIAAYSVLKPYFGYKCLQKYPHTIVTLKLDTLDREEVCDEDGNYETRYTALYTGAHQGVNYKYKCTCDEYPESTFDIAVRTDNPNHNHLIYGEHDWQSALLVIVFFVVIAVFIAVLSWRLSTPDSD